jgi:thiol:disulfide interchange protein DsbA
MKKLLVALGFAAALAGCSQKSAPVAEAKPPAAASSESSATPAAPGAAETPAAAETAAADATPALVAKPLAGNWKEGTNYTLINPAQPTTVEPGQVEIIEFMWLGCPHCYSLNPFMEAWRMKLPAYVAFRQEHVTWDAARTPHARLFYTIQALGAGDALVVKAFDQIHLKQNPLMGRSDAETQQIQQEFMVANGIDAAAFKREYNGFSVNASIKRADDLVRRYRVDNVPTLIVNGKYRTGVDMAGSPEKLVQLLTDLAAAEKGR